jgi:hypothetical protein
LTFFFETFQIKQHIVSHLIPPLIAIRLTVVAVFNMTTQETKFHVILFPADGRAPHLVNMPVSAVGPDYYMYSIYSPEAALVPHPEIHMEYIAVAETIGGPAHQALVSP